MSDENFLARWSRRKAEAAKADTEKRDAETATPQETNDATAEGSPKTSPRAPTPESTPATPAEVAPIDLKDLPPIDSIGPDTDVSVFLRPGVPAELARAALRRAWTTDPAIRDYIGLSENSWDFTAPHGVPGFGPLSPEDAQRLLAAFMGQPQQSSANVQKGQNPASRDALQNQPQSTESEVGPTRNQIANAAGNEQLQARTARPLLESVQGQSLQGQDTTAAMQHIHFDPPSRKPVPRRGGRALPQ